MKARVLAKITEQEPWGGAVKAGERGHGAAERALTPGPWHQGWPFHCYFCTDVYSDHAHYPYCSTQCAISAENS